MNLMRKRLELVFKVNFSQFNLARTMWDKYCSRTFMYFMQNSQIYIFGSPPNSWDDDDLLLTNTSISAYLWIRFRKPCFQFIIGDFDHMNTMRGACETCLFVLIGVRFESESLDRKPAQRPCTPQTSSSPPHLDLLGPPDTALIGLSCNYLEQVRTLPGFPVPLCVNTNENKLVEKANTKNETRNFGGEKRLEKQNMEK